MFWWPCIKHIKQGILGHSRSEVFKRNNYSQFFENFISWNYFIYRIHFQRFAVRISLKAIKKWFRKNRNFQRFNFKQDPYQNGEKRWKSRLDPGGGPFPEKNLLFGIIWSFFLAKTNLKVILWGTDQSQTVGYYFFVTNKQFYW